MRVMAKVLNLSQNKISSGWEELLHCVGLQALDVSNNKLEWAQVCLAPPQRVSPDPGAGLVDEEACSRRKPVASGKQWLCFAASNACEYYS